VTGNKVILRHRVVVRWQELEAGVNSSFDFRKDGFFNMTSPAQALGKRLDNFWTSKETTDYTAALADQLKVNPGTPGITPCYKATGYHALKGALVETQRGHHTHANVGTWANPKLAAFFARWLGVRFAVWCDDQIERIMRGEVKAATRPVVPTVGGCFRDFGQEHWLHPNPRSSHHAP
jgi:hypothetical protein